MLSGHARATDADGELRLTKQAKFWSWVAGSALATRLSLPGPRSMPWHCVDMQPGPRPTPSGWLRSTAPDRIGRISERNTPRLNLSTGAQPVLLPGLLRGIILASSYHVSYILDGD